MGLVTQWKCALHKNGKKIPFEESISAKNAIYSFVHRTLRGLLQQVIQLTGCFMAKHQPDDIVFGLWIKIRKIRSCRRTSYSWSAAANKKLFGFEHWCRTMCVRIDCLKEKSVHYAPFHLAKTNRSIWNSAMEKFICFRWMPFRFGAHSMCLIKCVIGMHLRRCVIRAGWPGGSCTNYLLSLSTKQNFRFILIPIFIFSWIRRYTHMAESTNEVETEACFMDIRFRTFTAAKRERNCYVCTQISYVSGWNSSACEWFEFTKTNFAAQCAFKPKQELHIIRDELGWKPHLCGRRRTENRTKTHDNNARARRRISCDMQAVSTL